MSCSHGYHLVQWLVKLLQFTSPLPEITTREIPRKSNHTDITRLFSKTFYSLIFICHAERTREKEVWEEVFLLVVVIIGLMINRFVHF